MGTQLSTLLGSGYSDARSINNSGQIVGVSAPRYHVPEPDYGFWYVPRAILWDNGLEIDLNSFLSASDVSAGWVLKQAYDINDNGWIIGSADNTISGLSRGFLLQSVTPVPEADTSAMLLTGLGVVWLMVRRRKNTQA